MNQFVDSEIKYDELNQFTDSEIKDDQLNQLTDSDMKYDQLNQSRDFDIKYDQLNKFTDSDIKYSKMLRWSFNLEITKVHFYYLNLLSISQNSTPLSEIKYSIFHALLQHSISCDVLPYHHLPW